jgi:hypothetical protein
MSVLTMEEIVATLDKMIADSEGQSIGDWFDARGFSFSAMQRIFRGFDETEIRAILERGVNPELMRWETFLTTFQLGWHMHEMYGARYEHTA